MIEKDWIYEKMEVQGTFHECQALTSFFTWRGPPVIGVEGLTMEGGRVVNQTLGTPRFGSPRKILRLNEQYEENKGRYAVHETATLELYRLRTEDSTKGAYFIPSETPLQGSDEFEGILTAESTSHGCRLWHQRTRFSMEFEDRDEHARVCVPLDSGIPEISEGRSDETGLGERFEPLVLVKPMSHSLKGAVVD